MRTRAIPFSELTASELGLWTALLKRDQFSSPFLAHEFCKAANQVTGNVFVSSLGGGDDTAFLPFQRRAYFPTIADKIGGHMSDWFGIVGSRQKSVAEGEILSATGLSVFCFDHWLRSECPVPFEIIVEGQGFKVNLQSPKTYFTEIR